MKPLSVIGLFLFALVACVKVPEPVEGPTLNNTPSPNLAAIDTLMWRQPDSALTLLLPWFDTCCRDAARHVTTATTYNRHYAHLLLSELLYKNDYPQANRMELLQAVAYFDSLVGTQGADTFDVSLQGRHRKDARRASAKNATPTNVFLNARAHYINGVGYYENDSAVPACKEYMKALDVMENHFKEKDLVGRKAKFIALTYTRLTDLFSDSYLHEQAIYFAQLSLASNQELGVPDWQVARMLCEIGIQYNLLEQLDSADCYYESAAKVLNDTSCLLYRDISTRQIVLSYKKKGIEENTLLILHYLMSKSNGEAEYLLRCFTIGGVFYQEKQFDSAWYYLNKVYKNTERIALKKQAAEWLLDICKTQGRYDDVFEYADFLAPFANREENQSEVKSQLTELYNSHRQTVLSRQHKKIVRKNTTIGLAIIGGLLVGLLVYVFLYHNNKRRKQLLEKQIIEEKQVYSMEKKALSSRLKKSNETLRELQGQIKQQNRNSSISSETQPATFLDEPICRLIMERVHDGQFKSKIDCGIYKQYALDKQQLLDLRVAADSHFNHFTLRLRKAYPKLTNIDIDYCCLYLLNLTHADVSALMQRAYNTVVERDSKIQKVFGSKKPLPVILTEIAHNASSV